MGEGEDNNKMANQQPGSKARDINWAMVLYYVHIHIGALFGIYYIFTEAKILTTLFSK